MDPDAPQPGTEAIGRCRPEENGDRWQSWQPMWLALRALSRLNGHAREARMIRPHRRRTHAHPRRPAKPPRFKNIYAVSERLGVLIGSVGGWQQLARTLLLGQLLAGPFR